MEETDLFENYFKFATAVDVNEYLNQIKLPISLQTYASCFLLPSNIRTKIQIFISYIGTFSEKGAPVKTVCRI